MTKIGICLCGEVSKKCTANGCMRAFNDRSEAFNRYEGKEVQLVAINTCHGCDASPVDALDLKIEKFLKAGVDTVHLSTCIRGRCDHYETFANKLSTHFDVMGYTHGSEKGKQGNNLNILHVHKSNRK